MGTQNALDHAQNSTWLRRCRSRVNPLLMFLIRDFPPMKAFNWKFDILLDDAERS